MRTKLADIPRTRPLAGTPPLAAPAIADTRAYWLEKPGETRVTRLYRHADTSLIFAGRALAPFFAALRHDPGDPITDPEITDERVY